MEGNNKKVDAGMVRLQEEQQKSLNFTLNRIEQWRQFEKDYYNLHSFLGTISDNLTHNVMVPFGKLAFAPGKLVDTNEILVLLGDNWFVERSTKQAQGIVERRLKSCQETLRNLEMEKEQSEGWIKHTQYALGEGVKEIIEEYDPARDVSWKDRRKHGKHREDKKKGNIQSRAESPDIPARTSRVRWQDQDSKSCKVISFKHSEKSPPDTLQFQIDEIPETVTSPGDIWHIFGSPTVEKKSILKPAKPQQSSISNTPVSQAHKEENQHKPCGSTEENIQSQEELNQAFTGTIVESDSIATTKAPTEVQKRPVSRFKAQRLKK